MRRLVWLAFLCFVLLLTVTGCTEPQQGVEGNLRWSLDRWGTLTIEGEGAIPGYSWSEPRYERVWDAALAQATHLVIGEGITEIGYSVFYGMPRLKTVELPDGLTRIEDYAFMACPKLKNIVLPDSVTEIGVGAFSYCDALTELRIPAGVTELPVHLISDSNNVRRIYLPAGLESISYVGDCTSLEEILVDEGNPNLISRDGVLFSADGTVLLVYPMGKKDEAYTVPEGVTEIGPWAFYHALFTEVVLPQGLRTIGRGGFSNCRNLCTIRLPQALETIEADAFGSCFELDTIRLPDSVASLGKNAFANCSNLQEIKLPSQLTAVADGLLSGTSLTSIDLPKSVSNIGQGAYHGCDSLTTVEIPATVKQIDSGAFSRCENLTAFVVDEGNTAYTAIDGVLYTADGTTLVIYPTARKASAYHVPDGVTHIAPMAFWYVDGLESVTMADSVHTLGEELFAYCRDLKYVAVSSQVTELPERMFMDCDHLTTLSLPAGLRRIGEAAFTCVESLKRIDFAGTEEQWNNIEVVDGRDSLPNAEIIFGAN